MTKEEFKKLGVTDRDLVALTIGGEAHRLVGSLCHTTNRVFVGSDPSRASKGKDMECVKSIEIIKNNFWGNDE